MIKVLTINKQTVTAEVEVSLEDVLPRHETSHKSALKRLLENPEAMKEIKRLEKKGCNKLLAAFIQRKIRLYHG